MRTKIWIILLAIASLFGCAPLITDQDKYVTAFSPHIEKDGTQSFTFIANKELPSLMANSNVRDVHESWISSELGKRQFCMKGYEILSTTEEAGKMLIYKGQCK